MGGHLVPDAHHDVPVLCTGSCDSRDEAERRRLGDDLSELRHATTAWMVTWPEADVPKQIYLDLAVSDLDAQCMKRQAAAESAVAWSAGPL